jgi:hypothetical protein
VLELNFLGKSAYFSETCFSNTSLNYTINEMIGCWVRVWISKSSKEGIEPKIPMKNKEKKPTAPFHRKKFSKISLIVSNALSLFVDCYFLIV